MQSMMHVSVDVEFLGMVMWSHSCPRLLARCFSKFQIEISSPQHLHVIAPLQIRPVTSSYVLVPFKFVLYCTRPPTRIILQSNNHDKIVFLLNGCLTAWWCSGNGYWFWCCCCVLQLFAHWRCFCCFFLSYFEIVGQLAMFLFPILMLCFATVRPLKMFMLLYFVLVGQMPMFLLLLLLLSLYFATVQWWMIFLLQ